MSSIQPAIAQPTESEIETLKQDYDWIPIENLTEEQLQLVKHACCGAFVAPPPQSPGDPQTSDTQLSVDTWESTAENVYILEGNVKIVKGSLELRADKATSDASVTTAELDGNIEVRQPGFRFNGDRAIVNSETGAARIDNARFVLHEQAVHGSAETLAVDEWGVMTMDNSEFTRCEPADKQWALKGSRIIIDRERHQGVGRHVRLNLYGVPVFYSPYLRFPVGSERLSGFLFPSLGSEDIAIPYYFNLAPNYDLTVAPRVIQDRGTMLEMEFRHLSRWFNHELSLGWLGNGEDGISDAEQQAIDNMLLTTQQATQYEDENRWLLDLQQQGGLGYNWYSTIDYTKVSDIDYFLHLNTSNLEVRKATHLTQAGEVGYRFNHWDVSTRIEEYQTILVDTQEPYRQKPRVLADGLYQWGDWQLGLDHEFTRFEHREPFTDPNNPVHRRIEGDRLRSNYKLIWNQEWLWGFFKPGAMVKTLSYQLDDDTIAADSEDSPSIAVAQGTLDMGLLFERDGSWFGNGYLQTFEPRVFYFYSDFESHEELFGVGTASNPNDRANIDFDTSEMTFSYNQLFRDSRFAGGDRIEDANQVSVGLTSRFLGNDSGVERLRLSLGQIFYREDRRVTLNGAPLTKTRSEIAGQLAAQLTDSWRFSSDLLYDHEDNVVTSGNVSLRFLDESYRIFNLSYRYNRRPEGFDPANNRPIDRDDSQGDLSFIWPLSSRWNIIGRASYDFTYERELDSIFGLEYDSCCYRVRLVGRHWLDDDLLNVAGSIDENDVKVKKGIFFEFQFKGLGGIGTRVSSTLSEGVINYDKREEYLLQN